MVGVKRRIQGLKAEDYVFTDKGRIHGSSKMVRRMSNVCEKTGIPYVDRVYNNLRVQSSRNLLK